MLLFSKKFLMLIEKGLLKVVFSMKVVLTVLCFSIITVSCASSKHNIVSSSTLIGKTFILSNMYEDVKITISFENDRFFGFAGINTYNGNYEIRRGNILMLKNITSTKVSGPPNMMDIETKYMNYLNEVSYIELKGNILRIDTLDGESLIFKRDKRY